MSSNLSLGPATVHPGIGARSAAYLTTLHSLFCIYHVSKKVKSTNRAELLRMLEFLNIQVSDVCPHYLGWMEWLRMY